MADGDAPPILSLAPAPAPVSPTSQAPQPLPQKSRYTYRHLAQLSKFSVDSPLRVIAHIDLDAFYAQCEMVRLGVEEDKPLAVQQWQSLIAVNYPARAQGVSRHITATEAKKLCPNIQLVHVAVWRAGETSWSYMSKEPDISSAKACLDPYRAISKQILSVFSSATGPEVLLEKAGIDESFVDLSRLIHERLLSRYEVLRGPPPYNDPTSHLPLPNSVKLDWSESHLVANEGGDVGGEMAIDWDDVAMALGAEIVRDVRLAVREKLGYTCSAGISNNKMLAKLGSGYRKPFQQSVVRVSAIAPFLATFKFTKIRNLGGKLGTRISEHFNTESLTELLEVPLPQLTAFLNDDTATWVYNVIRGLDRSAVTPRTSIKSMLSAKSFRDPTWPTSLAEAQCWLKVFAADISSRLEDEAGAHRRPKNMSLNFANAAGARSRQTPIPAGTIEVELLLKVAEGLLRGVVAELGGDARAWPCMRMSVDVSGFEEREAGNRDIGGFFLKSEQQPRQVITEEKDVEQDEPEMKKRKVEVGTGRFFTPRDEEGEEEREKLQLALLPDRSLPPPEKRLRLNPMEGIGRFFQSKPAAAPKPSATPTVPTTGPEPASPPLLAEPKIPEREKEKEDHPKEMSFPCPDCDGKLISILEIDEHADWHFAKSLVAEERAAPSQPPPPPPPPPKSGSAKKGDRSRKRSKKGGGGQEKGQRKLAF